MEVYNTGSSELRVTLYLYTGSGSMATAPCRDFSSATFFTVQPAEFEVFDWDFNADWLVVVTGGNLQRIVYPFAPCNSFFVDAGTDTGEPPFGLVTGVIAGSELEVHLGNCFSPLGYVGFGRYHFDDGIFSLFLEAYHTSPPDFEMFYFDDATDRLCTDLACPVPPSGVSGLVSVGGGTVCYEYSGFSSSTQLALPLMNDSFNMRFHDGNAPCLPGLFLTACNAPVCSFTGAQAARRG